MLRQKKRLSTQILRRFVGFYSLTTGTAMVSEMLLELIGSIFSNDFHPLAFLYASNDSIGTYKIAVEYISDKHTQSPALGGVGFRTITSLKLSHR